MMKTAIILHGMPDKEEYYDPEGPAQSHRHWLPWIQRQLLLRDILAQTPELPKPYQPNYENWKNVFEQLTVNEETILIGHSCGAGFLVRWLSENKVTIPCLVLAAPWINPDKIELDLVGDFFDFSIDPETAHRIGKVQIFLSDNEPYEDIKKSAALIKTAWPKSELTILPGKGHFTMKDMGTDRFPELLDCLSK